jgi:AraC-like DNA-binding protein
MVRARALDGFSATVKALGGDPAAVYRAAGLPAGLNGNPDGWVPFHQVLQAYREASRSTGCPYFGMYLAANRDLSYLGPLILIFKYSENLRDGLESVARYIGIQNSGYSVSLSTNGTSATFRFNMSAPGCDRESQWIEESLTTTVKALRIFLGDSYAPAVIRMSHERISRPDQYRRYLGVEPEFGATEDAVIVDAATLAVTNERTDRDMIRFLRDYLDARVPSPDSDITVTVRSLLQDLIPTGNYSIDIVADQLNVHRRTLQRRLASAGVRYADLLDSCRASMAIEYLEERNMPIVNLAHMLGYSDQSAFNHAFRRWHGVSPTAWAEKNRSRSA